MMSGITTVAALLGFLGVCIWAYSRHNKNRFEQASRLPFDDEPGESS